MRISRKFISDGRVMSRECAPLFIIQQSNDLQNCNDFPGEGKERIRSRKTTIYPVTYEFAYVMVGRLRNGRHRDNLDSTEKCVSLPPTKLGINIYQKVNRGDRIREERYTRI